MNCPGLALIHSMSSGIDFGGFSVTALSWAKANCARDQGTSQPSTGTPKSLAMAGLSQLTSALFGSVST